MKTVVENKVKVKLFCGYQITSELRMYLNQSAKWKESQIHVHRTEEGYLEEVHFQGKEYVGFYLNEDRTDLQHLRELHNNIKKRFEDFCPDLNIGHISFCIFPQVFVA